MPTYSRVPFSDRSFPKNKLKIANQAEYKMLLGCWVRWYRLQAIPAKKMMIKTRINELIYLLRLIRFSSC